jgi:hypothetical protein
MSNEPGAVRGGESARARLHDPHPLLITPLSAASGGDDR